ncbi:hypothetical protein Aca07nite_56340 [Actinoplanes capillaceus]|uniref:Secreted protein n=1 Tax=Actinoplanes campanulatus TaxID=113559 RepID=A0ABQ3WQ86_9ACTN|nr:hypothetical protein Aca07nite_56340 [Actinoplanes capillaceus]
MRTTKNYTILTVAALTFTAVAASAQTLPQPAYAVTFASPAKAQPAVMTAAGDCRGPYPGSSRYDSTWPSCDECRLEGIRKNRMYHWSDWFCTVTGTGWWDLHYYN